MRSPSTSGSIEYPKQPSFDFHESHLFLSVKCRKNTECYLSFVVERQRVMQNKEIILKAIFSFIYRLLSAC